MDPECAKTVSLQPEEHRATIPDGPDPKCAVAAQSSEVAGKLTQLGRHSATFSAPHRWRFFWRVGPRPPPASTSFAELNAAPVVPEARDTARHACTCRLVADRHRRTAASQAFPKWSETMNQWGTHMITAATTVAEMAALG